MTQAYRKYKTFFKEIKEDPDKLRDRPYSYYYKDVRSSYRINDITTKTEHLFWKLTSLLEMRKVKVIQVD